MTLFGVDGSQFQGQMYWDEKELNKLDFALWRCGIGSLPDPSYKEAEEVFLAYGIPFCAYFFPLPVGIHHDKHGNTMRVNSYAEQAEVVRSQVDPRVPIMFDWEYSATWQVMPLWNDELAVGNEIRKRGYNLTILYGPDNIWWAYGKPDMSTLGAPGLVNPYYNNALYGDHLEIYSTLGGDTSAKGWVEPYGGMTQTFWQFTSRGSFCGKLMDWNAFKDTREELRKYFYVQGGSVTNPEFPQGYDLVSTPHQYDEIGSRKTLKKQLLRSTVANLDYEIQRRFAAVQLHLYEAEKILIGPGTGQRDSNPEVAAGNSWHQPIPYNGKNKSGARAIDTVGLPTHYTAWNAMQKYLNRYGLCSFMKGTNQFNYTGIAPKVKDDPPHVQAWEDPYSRPRNPLPLRHWDIPRRYDLDFLNLDDPLPDYTPPWPEPEPVGEDEEVFVGIWRSNGEPFSVYSNGTKVWITDPAMMNGAVTLAHLGGKDANVKTMDDLGMFAALGIVIGPIPPGHDQWGNKVA